MILEWIVLKNRKLHEDENLRKYSNKTARDNAPYVYADNLANCSADLRAEYMQQLQAKWLSAFCALSGLIIIPPRQHKSNHRG
jgi:hypothetical protein